MIFRQRFLTALLNISLPLFNKKARWNGVLVKCPWCSTLCTLICVSVCVSGLSVSILFVQGSVPSSVTWAQTLSKQAIWELDCLQNRFHFHSQENMCALVHTHKHTRTQTNKHTVILTEKPASVQAGSVPSFLCLSNILSFCVLSFGVGYFFALFFPVCSYTQTRMHRNHRNTWCSRAELSLFTMCLLGKWEMRQYLLIKKRRVRWGRGDW